MSEPGKQFEKIFEDWHNPQEVEKRKQKERREKRKEKIKKDAGI